MKNSSKIILSMITILIVSCFFSSCVTEEIIIIQPESLVDDIAVVLNETEEVPNNEDEITAINAFDDVVITTENIFVNIEFLINDQNLPEDFLTTTTEPLNGTVVINNNNTPNVLTDDLLVYTPNSLFSGTDSFEYTICDATNSENCDKSTVNITVVRRENDFATELKSFPTCQGAGCESTGGRKKPVYHVTNLNDSGRGSFRDAVSESNRTIVFDVSGTIILKSYLTWQGSNITVSGQTAPKGGITLQGRAIEITNKDNIIIRYIRRRQDRNDGGLASTGIQIRSCRNVVLDHVSIAYGRDESLLVYDNGTNVAGAHTISNCIISEGKTGVIIGSGASADRKGNAGTYSFHHNFISYMHRTPNTSGDGKFEIINNIIYNWQIRLTRANNNGEINHINNYYKPGIITNRYVSDNGIGFRNGLYVNKINDVTGTDGIFTGTVYTNGNDYNTLTGLTSDNWKAWFNFNENPNIQAAEDTFRVLNQFPFLGKYPIIPETAQSAFNSVLSDVGANKYLNADGSTGMFLDSNDTNYIEDAINGNDSYSQDQGRGLRPRWYLAHPTIDLPFPIIPTNTRPSDYDTDYDGMPDVWEKVIFGDLSRDGKGDHDGDGYSDLEEFLNLVDKE